MKNFLIITFFSLCSLLATGQDSLEVKKDSLTFEYSDLLDLYRYAKDGYYLKKIDSINGDYILTLELENSKILKKKQELEIIIRMDSKIISGLIRVRNGLMIDAVKARLEINDLKAIVKRLRREKRETIITGAVVATVLIIANIAK